LGQAAGRAADHSDQQKFVVGRNQDWQVPEAGEALSPLHLLARGGHQTADKDEGCVMNPRYLLIVSAAEYVV